MRKNWVAWVTILLVAAAIGLFIFFVGLKLEENNPESVLSPHEQYIVGFRLGDDITPYPPLGNGFDCDDAVLYSYLYLKGLDQGYDIKIMYGKSPMFLAQYHVWLDVSDNGTRWIYDLGMASQNYDSYKGKRITYSMLLSYAKYDQN